MVEKYRELLLQVAPPLILVDMDGCLVDWDQGTVDILWICNTLSTLPYAISSILII